MRDVTPLSEPTEWDQLSPDELAETLWILDGRPEDLDLPDGTDTTWSWDLDDPYPWTDEMTHPDAPL